MEKVKITYKNSGKNRIACIGSIKETLPVMKESTFLWTLKQYYKFLKNYCNYDKVYILSSFAFTDKENSKLRNSLADYKDILIYNIANDNVLLEYNIDDMFIELGSANFMGGFISHKSLYQLNAVVDWYKNKNENQHLYYIQDDPAFIKTDVPLVYLEKIRQNKLKVDNVVPKELLDKLLNVDYKYIEDICTDTTLLFCGLDYEKFYNNIKKNKPSVKYWDNFDCYVYGAMNDNLENKLVDFPYEDKKYDCEYHGASKSAIRTKNTEDFYGALKNNFLHIHTKNIFFKNINNFDKHDYIKYEELLQFICKHCKSILITHEPVVYNNQISPKFFDSMLSDIICFIDIKYDENKVFVNNDELKDFMYVSTPEEFSAKVDAISNDKELYNHIKKLQRKDMFEKYKEFIDKENIKKF